MKDYRGEKIIFKGRLCTAALIFSVLVLILLIRLFNLQIINSKYYQTLSQKNQLDVSVIEPNRGLIYDRNGILLAENLPIFTLTIIPDSAKFGISATIDGLKELIDIDELSIKQFYKKLKSCKKYEHILLKYRLTQHEVEVLSVNKFKFPGIFIDSIMIRHYPLGDVMTSVVGYVGKIGLGDFKNVDTKNYTTNSFIGKVGIEKFYEKRLRGRTGYSRVEVNALGNVINKLENISSVSGDNIYVTIDSNLQKAALDALKGEKGAVVALDPNNGEILALVSSPSYDANIFSEGDAEKIKEIQDSPDKPMYNRAVRGLFSPGSTIKPFISIFALNNGVIDMNFSIKDSGVFHLPNSSYKYRDWMPSGHGVVNLSKAIITSCDIFFYTLAIKLGIEKLAHSLYNFGFGEKVGIDIDDEVFGLVPTPRWKKRAIGKSWHMGDTVLAGIGQGFVLSTPLQLANAVAILSKKGEYHQPRLFMKSSLLEKFENSQNVEMVSIDGTDGVLKVKLNDDKIWDFVIDAMKSVVMSSSGTAYLRFGGGYSYTVAAKTGTSQLFHHKFNDEIGTFQSQNNTAKKLRNHSLLIGFAPVENPRIAFAVIVENSDKAIKVARQMLDVYMMTVGKNLKQSVK